MKPINILSISNLRTLTIIFVRFYNANCIQNDIFHNLNLRSSNQLYERIDSVSVTCQHKKGDDSSLTSW